MRLMRSAIALTSAVAFVCTGACARRRVTHVAPDESKPHISWEIRAGGDMGDADLVCESSQGNRRCALDASTDKRRSLATVHVYFHAAARETTYLGLMKTPFIQGEQGGIRDISVPVATNSQPVTATVAGIVTSRSGIYAFDIAIDAMQPGWVNSQPVAEKVPVTVK
jgi:hypothetical protein